MNTISWMIYLADLLGGLGGVAVAVAVIAGGATLAAAIACPILAGGPDLYSFEGHEERQRKIAANKTAMDLASKVLKRGPLVLLAGALVAAVLPSPQTVYAIAASEAGKQMLESETAGKAVKALNAWLDRQIAE